MEATTHNPSTIVSLDPPTQTLPARPGNSDNRRNRPRTRRNNQSRSDGQLQDAATGTSAQEHSLGNRGHGRQRTKPPGEDGPAGPSNTPRNINYGGRRPLNTTPKDRTGNSTSTTAAVEIRGDPSHPTPNLRPGRRGAKFNASLTNPLPSNSGSPSLPQPSDKHRNPRGPENDDLTSTLIYSLRTPPYPDCPICFVPIHPAQPTWSCSPSIPISSNADTDDRVDGTPLRREKDNGRCCWTTFHVKCIREWARKSVKEIEDAWRARGENRRGEWRCPGCQAKREDIPSGYWCFCGSTPEPKLARLATPHSCASSCSRPRSCIHPCSELCHPGPCPPCLITIHKSCYCGQQRLSFRCSHLLGGTDAALGTELSCGNVCGKKLGCMNHTCKWPCHAGSCQPCDVKEMARCYCGKEAREVGCGDGEGKVCIVDGKDGQVGEKWIGKFSCKADCNRPFDCGIHFCAKSCHQPSPTPPICPRSPSLNTHCPCGKHAFGSDTSAFRPGTQLSRMNCSDPIPTCTSTCMKPLASCNHVCSAKCHTGPCPPCSIMLVRPCRCGATTKNVQCSSLQNSPDSSTQDEILCDRPCAALRACGRHQCNRVCCPLAALVKGKGKKRGTDALEARMIDDTGLHDCDLVCGKMLGCGNHRCEERDHRGVCPPCLRSTFEEMVCHCGFTVLDPPTPCGTQINCTYPCNRPPPPCGHSRTQHSCHEDSSPCLPCPFLANKTCACGKKVVSNVRCSQEKVSCGSACRKLLACGFHHCERLCHGDDCGPCSSPCGKSRKLCLPGLHPCTLPCHAPSACAEFEPCSSIIMLSCPCGRIRQAIQCKRSTSNPGRELNQSQQPKCSNECNIAKRNAKLADALGINVENREKADVVYGDELVGFASANIKFLALVEKAFLDFVTSEKKTQVLPHMPMDRRKFVHDLATIYRMDTQMVDQEPHRSVQLLRRIDTRMPARLLSATVTSSASAGLGKLADLRSPSIRTLPPSRSVATPSPATPAGPQRGWTSVTSRPGSVAGADGIRAAANASPTRKPVARPVVMQTAATGPPPLAGPTEAVPDDWEDDV